jgi:hypothetical protein
MAEDKRYSVLISVPTDQAQFKDAATMEDLLARLAPVESAIEAAAEAAGDEYDGTGLGGGCRDYFVYSDDRMADRRYGRLLAERDLVALIAVSGNPSRRLDG